MDRGIKQTLTQLNEVLRSSTDDVIPKGKYFIIGFGLVILVLFAVGIGGWSRDTHD
ncbi:MAG: hypothetical protein HN379_00895 [Desulfobacteraceae bacterium]|jgi:hypothetical protein|nr:hypothetical protein [Desulfobacteraceae bacterium]